MKSVPVLRCRIYARTFVDLGMSPLCETYPSSADFSRGEVYYPLHVYVCDQCFLVQLEEYESAENIFSDYAYFSSYSDSWLKHADNYCGKMVSSASVSTSRVLWSKWPATTAICCSISSRGKCRFWESSRRRMWRRLRWRKAFPRWCGSLALSWRQELAAEGRCADLILGNNVLAQVPDLNDFVEGLKIMLKPEGVLTLEFPHLLRLIEHNEFDTIYHEHFSYFSMLTTVRIMEAHGLRVFDVEELPTHGGSLRVYACRLKARRTAPSRKSES